MSSLRIGTGRGTRTSSETGAESPLIPVIAAGALGVLWLSHLGASFWLDETGTAWVADETPSDVIERAQFQGQSPVYYLIAWAARALLGDGEVALRVPSILGAGLAAFFMYRLARRLFDAEAAWLAALVFVSLTGVALAAADARPYALALAGLIASSLALVAWMDSGRTRDALAWVALTTLTLYLSYTFAIAFVAHAIYAIVRRRSGGPVGARASLTAAAAVGVLMLPAAPQIVAIAGQQDILAWAREGASFKRLLLTLVPWTVAAAWGAGFVMGRLKHREGVEPPLRATGALALSLTWAVVPPLLLFLLAWPLSPKVFQPRYYLSAAPGIALLGALALRSLTPRAARMTAAVLLVPLALVAVRGHRADRQDWRAAAAAVNRAVAEPTTPVLLHTGFASERIRQDDPRIGLLLAPATAYPMRGRLVYVPFDITERTIPALTAIAAGLRDERRFVLVTSFDVADFRGWFADNLAGQGFTAVRTLDTRYLDVDLFERA